MRLYTSAGDTDVAVANTRSCAADLAHRGVKVRVVDQGDVSHNETYLTSGPQIVRWIDGLAARR
ncbi:hypothetical protein [Streptomyces sp. col6]|uniref:hypothetical protein n=1 Tax=Streptomyces sp. col6 TaxID=2478958 RepID=UPI001CD12F34|nr:hypothetical protein [Streptomyces sp. col6]